MGPDLLGFLEFICERKQEKKVTLVLSLLKDNVRNDSIMLAACFFVYGKGLGTVVQKYYFTYLGYFFTRC